MFYLADFKRRYEKELLATDENGKYKYKNFKGGHQTKTSNITTYLQGKRFKGRSVVSNLGTSRSIVINARKLEKEYGQVGKNKNVLGRYKYSKQELDAQKQNIRKHTGGYDDPKKKPVPTTRQRKIATKVEANKKRLFELEKEELRKDLWESPPKERLPKTEIKQTKTVTTKRIKASDRPKVNFPERPKIEINPKDQKLLMPSNRPAVKLEEKKLNKSQVKNPITSEPSNKTITTKKVTKGVGRKVLTGLGIGTLGVGALYGLNRLRKTRKDKGKIRGKYKK